VAARTGISSRGSVAAQARMNSYASRSVAARTLINRYASRSAAAQAGPTATQAAAPKADALGVGGAPGLDQMWDRLLVVASSLARRRSRRRQAAERPSARLG